MKKENEYQNTFVSDLFEAMGRMSNANQAKQIFVSTAFLLLLRTVTSLDVGKEVYMNHHKSKIATAQSIHYRWKSSHGLNLSVSGLPLLVRRGPDQILSSGKKCTNPFS